jgi:hypothetical protein
MYGPLVLAAQMGKDGLTKEMVYGNPGRCIGKSTRGPSEYLCRETKVLKGSFIRYRSSG